MYRNGLYRETTLYRNDRTPIYQALLLVFDHISDESGHTVIFVSLLASLMEDQVKYLRSLGLSVVNISSNVEVDRAKIEKENIQLSMAHLKHGL